MLLMFDCDGVAVDSMHLHTEVESEACRSAERHAPENCLVIEDGVAGVQGGAADIRVLGFVGGSHHDEGHKDRLISAGAELVFSNMRELPSLLRSSSA